MFEPVSHHNSYSVYIKTLVGIKKGLYNVEAREWDSLMYDGNFYRVMPRLASLREEPGASKDLALWCSISNFDS